MSSVLCLSLDFFRMSGFDYNDQTVPHLQYVVLNVVGHLCDICFEYIVGAACVLSVFNR